MIAKKKIAAITLSTIMAASILTGCGAGSSNSAVNETEQAESSAKTANIADYKGSTFTGRVTSINGNEITVSIGGGPMGEMGQRPDQNSDDGNRPTPPDMNSNDVKNQASPDSNSNDSNRLTSPDMNNDDGNMPTPPEMNNDDDNRQAPPDMNSSDANNDNSSDNRPDRKDHESKTITFTIDDESVLEDIEISDITENTRLAVTVDDNGKISKVAKSSDNMKPGDKGERPDKAGSTSNESTSSDNKANDNDTDNSDNGESSL